MGSGLAKLTPPGMVVGSGVAAYELTTALLQAGLLETATAAVQGVADLPADLHRRLNSEDPKVRGEAFVEAITQVADAKSLATRMVRGVGGNGGRNVLGASPGANGDSHVPLDLTGHRSAHILSRHRSGAGLPSKTEFPSNWSDVKILDVVSDIATDPSSTVGVGKWDSPYVVGTRDGVTVRVDFYPPNHPIHAGKISTAYPINVPPNP